MPVQTILFVDYQNAYHSARTIFHLPGDRSYCYPHGWPNERPVEKGIDVALAVDFVAMALLGQYDVGILMSNDSDLKPALEAVAGLGGRPYPRGEIAAWSYPKGHYSPRLSIKGAQLWCHWLRADDYDAVADLTDYRVGRGQGLGIVLACPVGDVGAGGPSECGAGTAPGDHVGVEAHNQTGPPCLPLHHPPSLLPIGWTRLLRWHPTSAVACSTTSPSSLTPATDAAGGMP